MVWPPSLDLILCALGAVWSVLAFNVHRPIRPTVTMGTVAFFLGWLFGELAGHHAIFQLACLGWFAYEGALDSAYGMVGAALTIGSAAALLRYHERGHAAGLAGLRSLAELGPVDESRVPNRSVARPFSLVEKGVTVQRGLRVAEVEGATLMADVYRASDATGPGPLLVYVHGGGWTIGYRQYQGLPILSALAKLGFTCVSVSYRLSPRATFPDHIHDVYRGLAWAKEHAASFGARPGFVAVVGNSAGAHLAALAALGHDEPRLRPPELEGHDLRVDALVGIYGVYDFTDRFGHWPGAGITPFVERVVLKRSREQDPDLFRVASPVDLVRADAPATLLIHGNRDTLAPVGESRRFAEALRAVSTNPVAYAEIEGAQHAFEIFHSIRGRYAVRTIATFLERVRERVTARAA